VIEIAAHDASGTYRAVYTGLDWRIDFCDSRFPEEAKAGIATPKPEMEVIRQRLRQLKTEVKDAEKRNP